MTLSRTRSLWLIPLALLACRCLAQDSVSAQLEREEKSLAVKAAYLDCAITPERAQSFFRDAFAKRFNDVGIQIVSDPHKADVILHVSAMATFHPATAKSQKVSQAIHDRKLLLQMQAIDGFDVHYQTAIAAEWAPPSRGGYGNLMMLGETAETAMAALGDRLALEMRQRFRPGMKSVNRIYIADTGNDAFSRHWRAAFGRELTAAGFAVTNDPEDADAQFTGVFNVSQAEQGYEIHYMYQMTLKGGFSVDSYGSGQQIAVSDPEKELDKIAKEMATDYDQRKKK